LPIQDVLYKLVLIFVRKVAKVLKVLYDGVNAGKSLLIKILFYYIMKLFFNFKVVKWFTLMQIHHVCLCNDGLNVFQRRESQKVAQSSTLWMHNKHLAYFNLA